MAAPDFIAVSDSPSIDANAVRRRRWFFEYRVLWLIWAVFMATIAASGYAAIEHLRPASQPPVIMDVAAAQQAALAQVAPGRDRYRRFAGQRRDRLHGFVRGDWPGIPEADRPCAPIVRAAERLRASERQLRDFAEISSDWFWEQDAELRFRWLSRPALFNRTGDRSYWAPRGGNSPIGWIRASLGGTSRRSLPPGSRFATSAISCAASEGRIRYVSASGLPMFDDAGIFIGYRGTARDVTDGG